MIKRYINGFRLTALAILASIIAATGSFAAPPLLAPSPMVAVKTFSDALPREAKSLLFLPFQHPERHNFGWVPGTRQGLGLKEIEAKHHGRLFNVLRSVLSPYGFDKIKAVLAAEAALAVIENAPSYRDPQKYWLTIFGKPAPKKLWGLRFEGHHLSLNVTLNGDDIVAATPTFIGSNPARIPAGPHKGLRPLAKETDTAWALFNSLSDDQRKSATSGGGLFGGFKTSAGTIRYQSGTRDGLSAVLMSDKQREMLLSIIRSYVAVMPEKFSQAYMDSLFDREINQLHFFWRGAKNPGESFLFRIQGNRVMIEHDAHEGANHVHSIWRDRKQDFGFNF